MLKSFDDISVLSGYSSCPLSARAYCAGVGTSPCVTAYVQTDNTGNGQALVLNDMGNITVCLKGSPEIEEIISYIHLSDAVSVTSVTDVFLGLNGYTKFVYPLYSSNAEYSASTQVRRVTSEFTTAEYRSIYEVIYPYGEDFNAWYSDYALRISRGNADGTVFTENGRVLGCALSPAISPDYLIISAVSVTPDNRNRGIARKCIESLCCYNSNKTAVLWCEQELGVFYEKLGFIKVGNIYQYIKTENYCE